MDNGDGSLKRHRHDNFRPSHTPGAAQRRALPGGVCHGPSRNRHYLEIRLARGSIAGLRALEREPALHKVRTPDGAVLCTVTRGPAYGELEALQRPVASRQPASQANPQ